MLKKLMKYEFLATGRVFVPLFAALIILSGVNRLLSYLPIDAPQVIGIIVSVILMVGIMVLTLILTLQRFRSNLLSSEGHLMMTLPVRTDHLILGKMFTAAVWGIASFIVVMLSIMIMTAVSFSDIANALRPITDLIPIYGGQMAILVIEALIAIIVSLFFGILLVYACMSLSMLVNKRRGLFTFGAFVVITTALQTVFAIVFAIFAALDIADLLSLSSLSTFSQAQVAIIFWIVCEVALCVVFYFITRGMLKNRLNLQ